MKKLPAKLSVHRVTDSQGDGYVRIEVNDPLSNCIAMRLDVDFESFAKALLGLSYLDCLMEINLSGVIGKKHEHKKELVPFNGSRYREDDKEAAKKALAPFERDGWSGSVDDLFNHHRHTRKDGADYQTVTFHRHVADDATPPQDRAQP